MRTILNIFGMLLTVFIVHCMSPINTANGGSGTKTGNPAIVTGMIINKNGKCVNGALVVAHKVDYLHNMSSEQNRYLTTTDKNGIFRLSIIDTGNFNIEINDTISNATLLRCIVKNEDVSINLGTEVILPYAAIKGVYHGAQSGKLYYAHVYGMERTVSVDSFGNFHFNNLPSGKYSVCITKSIQKTIVETYNLISVNSGDTAVIPFTNLKYSKKVFLNTTSSGIAISSDLYNIPVLIRLTSADINFSQASPSGRDLRFRKVDGSPLVHEIDHWDTTNNNAGIWLLLDTLHENTKSECVIMHWGIISNEDTVENENILFDSTNGFIGVWHLGENIGDVSSYKHKTTAHGTFTIPGMIGAAQKFSGKEFIEIDGLLGKPTQVTLSAWVNLERVGILGSEIISLGDAVLIRMDDTLGHAGGVLGAYHIDTISSTGKRHYETTSNRYLQSTGWHYLCYIVDSDLGKQMLFIDGELSVVTDCNHSLVYDKVGKNTLIGMHGDSATAWNFIGVIDEVQISSVCRSSDWIKFSYYNQYKNKNFIRFEP